MVVAVTLVAALGIVAVMVALKIYFPEEKLRAMTISAARRQLGREVRLRSVVLSVRGLTLSGLEISESPDFGAGTFLNVDTFRLRPSWKALLCRRFVVATVSAEGFHVRVVKSADGKFNYSTLASTAAAGPSEKTDDAAPAELDVRHAQVSKGEVEYFDHTSGQTWSISEIDSTVDDFNLAGPFKIDAKLRLRGVARGRAVDAKISLSGEADLTRGDLSVAKVDVRRFVLDTQGVRLSASGTITGFETPRVNFEADLTVAGKNLLHCSGATTVGAVLAVDIKAQTAALDTTLIAKFFPQTGIPALSVPNARWSATVLSSGTRVDIPAFDAAWDGGKISGSGTLAALGSAHPTYGGQASFDMGVPAIAPGQYPFLNLPSKLSIPAGHLAGAISYAGDDLRLTKVKVTVKAGSVVADGSVKRLGSARPLPDLAMALDLDFPAFRVSDLPIEVTALPAKFVVPPARVKGKLQVKGDDLFFDGLEVTANGSNVRITGAVAKALAGAAQPDISIIADLDLPALTDKDVPLRKVPAGMALPPSKWKGDISYSPRLLKIRGLSLKIGRNEFDASGSVADPTGRGGLDLLVKCRSFELAEIAQLTPQVRDLSLSGNGYFAVSLTGNYEKPVYGGKVQFKSFGATVADLTLADFIGTVSFDQKRIDVPNLVGKVGDGTLKMDLTVKYYARSAEIQLEADLDRFDLGRYLAAREKLKANQQPAKASAARSPESKPAAFATRGHLNVGKLTHPNAMVEDVRLGWDLREFTSDLRTLGGEAQLRVGGGTLHAVGDLATQSKFVKVMLFPLLIVQKISRIGGIRLFPDFNNITLNQFIGDYVFKEGLMTLRQSEMDSDAARVSAKGTIDLPREILDLIVTAQVALVAPIDVAVTGTFDQPKSNVRLGKFIDDRAKQLIQGLLKR